VRKFRKHNAEKDKYSYVYYKYVKWRKKKIDKIV
jgi:hypothetical protein